jgi:hypothetical protein
LRSTAAQPRRPKIKRSLEDGQKAGPAPGWTWLNSPWPSAVAQQSLRRSSGASEVEARLESRCAALDAALEVAQSEVVDQVTGSSCSNAWIQRSLIVHIQNQNFN